jgi:hypothetical protein
LPDDPNVTQSEAQFAMLVRWAARTKQAAPVREAIARLAAGATRFILYERISVDVGYSNVRENSRPRFDPALPGKQWMDENAHAGILLIYEDPDGIGYVTNFARPRGEDDVTSLFGRHRGVHCGVWRMPSRDVSVRRNDAGYAAAASTLRKLADADADGEAFRLTQESKSYDGATFYRLVRYGAGGQMTLAAVNIDDTIAIPDLLDGALWQLWLQIYHGPDRS